MHFQKKTNRNQAARQAFFGKADQMSHEVDERLERSKMKGQLSEQRQRAKQRAARHRAATTGANAGTMGGSRGALMRTFMGKG